MKREKRRETAVHGMTDIVWKCSFDGGAKRGSPGGEKTAIVRSQRGLGIPCPTVLAGTAQKGKRMRFEELNLSAPLLEAIAQLDFTEMTEIQEKAIPLLLEGKDVIGKSNTGTGKTAAFSIPILEQMGQMPQEERRNVCALILCPTRELAMQACDEIRKFSRFQRQIKPVAVYGGASMERQIYQLKNGANLVVGTPGRVLDHLRRRTLKLDNLKTIVLDEADEMLNMGFREDIESVLAQIPEERQTVLFSATMPPAILAITKQYQNDPVLVQIQSAHRTVDAIAQFSVSVPMGRKTDALQLLLLSKQPKSAMIFCNTKKMVDELTEALCLRGFSAAGLHGDMKQLQRTQVMNGFKSGRNTILIATDVAARGIDVKGVDAVFNYDLPQDHEYISTASAEPDVPERPVRRTISSAAESRKWRCVTSPGIPRRTSPRFLCRPPGTPGIGNGRDTHPAAGTGGTAVIGRGTGAGAGTAGTGIVSGTAAGGAGAETAGRSHQEPAHIRCAKADPQGQACRSENRSGTHQRRTQGPDGAQLYPGCAGRGDGHGWQRIRQDRHSRPVHHRGSAGDRDRLCH
ncbi:MAG: DEAD/DEAH box helicase [Ruminococcus sp.]